MAPQGDVAGSKEVFDVTGFLSNLIVSSKIKVEGSVYHTHSIERVSNVMDAERRGPSKKEAEYHVQRPSTVSVNTLQEMLEKGRGGSNVDRVDRGVYHAPAESLLPIKDHEVAPLVVSHGFIREGVFVQRRRVCGLYQA